MNYQVERTRSRRGLLRKMGDRLTGGGVRALLQRLFWHVRLTGNRLNGGGLRSLSRQMATKSLRVAVSKPFLRALGRSVLQPFPRFSSRVYRLATTSRPERSGYSLSVNSLYKMAFGRLADPKGLEGRIEQLQSGVSLEILAEELVNSAEFEARHGSTQSVDVKYVIALFRDGLGREPDLESLAQWVTKGKKGATRAQVLVALAKSDEALERLHPSGSDDRLPYSRWIALYDTIGNADRTAIRAHIAGLPCRPLISVIMPIGKIREVALRESLHSLVTQLYPYWELRLSVDVATESLLARILGDFLTQDRRIRITRIDTQSGAIAINAALDLATGEFVAFLRAGDVLPEHALYEVGFALGGAEQPDIVYSDHDKLNSEGQRSDPCFKPGWDPDLLLAHNYIGPFAVYRRTLVEEIRCLRPEFEGAEFHDLALRATAATTPDRIRHIPAILYHRHGGDRPIHSENTLPCLRAFAASRRAIRDHLDSHWNTKAVLEPAPQFPSATRVVWPLPEHPPLVSVIVPTRDRADLVKCVEGVLHRTDYFNLELLIVDNGTIERATYSLIDRLTCEDSRIRILHVPGQFNYSTLVNAAARETNGEILILLDSDIDVIEASWMREMVSQALRPDVGIVGAKLLYANEQIQHAGIMLGPKGNVGHLCRLASKNDPGYFGQLALPRTLSAVTGACVAIRRSVFLEVGGFDEVNLSVAFNDVDLCLRLGDYGYRVIWTPFAELFHLKSETPKLEHDDLTGRARQHLRNTWGLLLESADPFHNPNVLFAWDYHKIPAPPRRRKPWRDLGEQALSLQDIFDQARELSH
jgi:glycosyltransferase involved in cell wall biosynthesis